MNITIKPKNIQDLSITVKNVIEQLNAPKKSQVVTVFDISESMASFYSSGIVDQLAKRVLALGLQLDNDSKVPVYTLGNDSTRLKDLTSENLENYVKQEIEPLVGTDTNYAPVINKIVDDSKEGDPMLVLLFTDGDNWDKHEAVKAIVRASNLPIFFQWYGIYRGSQPSFNFLEKLNELNSRDLKIDNCGFSPLGIDTEGSDTDEALYKDMLKEYKDFPHKAVQAKVAWSNKEHLRRRLFGLF